MGSEEIDLSMKRRMQLAGFVAMCILLNFFGNVFYGVTYGASYIYAVTSIVIGFLIGIMARKGRFETVFGTMTVSVVVTLAAVVVSVPLNFLFFCCFLPWLSCGIILCGSRDGTDHRPSGGVPGE